jgi:hypothetical protein
VRMPVSRLRQLAPLIQAAGLQISRELGYQGTGKGGDRSSSEKNYPVEARLAKTSL